jgi:hypothetical protein
LQRLPAIGIAHGDIGAGLDQLLRTFKAAACQCSLQGGMAQGISGEDIRRGALIEEQRQGGGPAD